MCAIRQGAIGVLAVVAVLTTARIDSQPFQPSDESRPHADTFQIRGSRSVDFIANHGQWDPRINFIARHGSITAAVERDTLALHIDGPQSTNVSLTFEHAASDHVIAGERKRSTHYNFYMGNDPRAWQSNVAAYAGVVYRGLYRGIDARLRELAGQLEYELRLEPGADLDQFVMRADGVSAMRIDHDGSLVLETPNGSLRQPAPTTWEELPGGDKRFLVSAFKQIDSQRYGFAVSGRDPARALVIDPGLVWSTFLGGSGGDFLGPAVVARDGSGDVFVGGTTTSTDFPLFTDASFAPGSQSPAFIARLDSTGSQLRYATFVGSWHAQLVQRGLAVDAGGNAVLVGQTYAVDFPVTPGAFSRPRGNKDAFVVRVDPTGGLIFSTMIGGIGEDDASAVAYDPAGNIIVGGTTGSADFPTTPNAYDPTYNTPNAPADGGADGDMFVARLTPDGSALTYGTFIGGPQADTLEDLVVDANGLVTVCGWVTGNNVQVFVTTPTAYDRTWNGSQDGAIARLKLDGAGAADLKYATLIGGSSQDNLWKAAIDPVNPELVTFAGRSWSNNYPVTAGVVRPTNPPFSQLFPEVEAGIITRFRFPAAGGGSLVWSTYHHSDRITGLTVNAAGEPIVVGPSAPWDMVTTRGAFDRTADGSGVPGGGFISRLSADATQYLYQSFFGGSGGIADNFQTTPQVAYVGGNTVIVSGQTQSNDFPITANAADPASSNAMGGSNEGFVTKIALDADASGDLSASPPALVSPADGATFHNGLLGRLEWSEVSDASGVEAYEFQVSTRADFPRNFIVHRGAIRAADAVIPPSVGNTGGLCLCTYYWRVRTADRAGNLSDWSTARTFTVSGSTGQPTISGINVEPASVTGGAQATGMLHLYEAAPAGGLTARLAVYHDRSQGLDRTRSVPVPAGVPEFVSIPAGALSAAFPITTSAVTDMMGLTLVATVNGVGGSGTLSVTPAGSGGPTPTNVSVLPGIVTGGTSAMGIVTISEPAPAGGTAVALFSSHPAIARVPASVTVTAGARTASFSITTSAPSTEIDVGIAARSGGSSWNRPFFVRPPNRLPKMTSMTISPSSVAGGSNSGGTLTFSGPIPPATWPAQPDGVVRFASSDPDAAALFASDEFVPAGSTNHTFRIFTRAQPTARTVTFTAYFDGTALTGSLNVAAVTGVNVTGLTANVTTMRGGEGGVATVTLGAAAPAPILVTVSSNHPELFSSLPPNLTIFAGSTSASFAFVTNKSVAASTAVSLSASYGASAANLGLTVNPPASATPPLVDVTLSPASVAGGTSSTGTVMLQGAAPAGGASVQLFSSNTAARVPATVTVPAGAASATFPITTSSVTSNTAVTISGLLRLSASRTLTVTTSASPPPPPPPPPSTPALSAISVNPQSVTGGSAAQGTVTLTAAAPSGGFAIALSSNNSVATVPASATVAAGASSATFTISTAAVSASSTATITASDGNATRTAALTVNPPGQAGTLTVSATGRSGERVTSSPAGIDVAVGSTRSASFTTGTSITLRVASGRDATWSGGCSSGGNRAKSCTFTLTGTASVTANVR
jgi:hypothetical protein